MNLSFNIAIHVLTFLTKHSNERFSSDALAEKVCVNAVQLRNVARIWKQHDYLDVHGGKAGGYKASKKDVFLQETMTVVVKYLVKLALRWLSIFNKRRYVFKRIMKTLLLKIF